MRYNRVVSNALSAHMIEADIVVETPLQTRLLLVECKWMKESSLERAAALRDSLTSLWTTDYEFFLLVLRTGLHLWRKEAVVRNYLSRTALGRADLVHARANEYSWCNPASIGLA